MDKYEIKELKLQLAEKDKLIEYGREEIRRRNKRIDEIVERDKKLFDDKNKEIEELKEWQQWYEMWHKIFQKQIEDLTTELETYRPTKLHGNGQCECFKCKQEGRQAREWTDWCSRYKGHTYCDDCLKEVLKEEQTPQTQLAIQELEKVKEKIDCEMAIREYDISEQTADVCVSIAEQIDLQIKELKGENDE